MGVRIAVELMAVSASYSCSQMLNLTLTKIFQGAFRSALISKVYSLHLQNLNCLLSQITMTPRSEPWPLLLPPYVHPHTLHEYIIETSTPLGWAWIDTLQDGRRYEGRAGCTAWYAVLGQWLWHQFLRSHFVGWNHLLSGQNNAEANGGALARDHGGV